MELITSADNAAVKQARKLLARRGRDRAGRFLVEGPRVLAEAGDTLREVFVTADGAAAHPALLGRLADGGVPVRSVTPEVLSGLADAVTPQGLVGVAERRRPTLTDLPAHARMVVACEAVGDPGNLGTIIRSADAAGADMVVCTAGSVDPTNPKAVRASAGSLFHLPVVTGATIGEVAALAATGWQLVGADAHRGTAPAALDLAVPTVLLLGGEAAGLSGTALAACSVTVQIPRYPRDRPGYSGYAESLNLAAAAAVLMFAVAAAQHPTS